ncbi:MAG TPA: winged helix-turn-helix domain-containing protein [Vicinamibacterales bacterium]|nr:winged helix-turn-helix domain-containing protein [Vicinamibacterales bacterium]
MADDKSHGEHQLYEFGPFRLDATDRLLWRDSELISLTPKALDLLVLLVESGGRVVTKEDLMRRLWPDAFVEEANLSHHVYKIREALGEHPDGGQYIDTLARRGYRFVAPVQLAAPRLATAAAAPPAPVATVNSTDESAESASGRRFLVPVTAIVLLLVATVGVVWMKNRRPATPVAEDSLIRSLAVLPFLPLEGSERDDALSVGMAASVITRLTKVNQLIVRPTSAIVKYGTGRDLAGIGREQAVDAIVDGQIQRDGDRVRVTVQLIRTRDGRPIWADKFDEKLQDVFAIQDAIAEKVVSRLQVTLTRDGWRRLEVRDTNNVVAYQAYLNGSYHLTTFAPGGFQKSVGYFNDAIRLEPGYARAHAGLAFAYAELAFVEPHRSELEALAKKHAEIARGLDETIPELHAALINIRQYHDWDWAATEAECQRLIELAPGDARSYQMHGWALSLLGRFNEGLAELLRAQAIDPRSATISGAVMSNLMWSRNFKASRTEAERLLAGEPGSPFGLVNLATLDLLEGRVETAVPTLERAPAPPVIRTGLLAYAYGVAGRRADAERQIATLKSMITSTSSPAYQIAMGYAGLGETRQAMDWLERAYGERSLWMAWLRVEPWFDKMREDGRFVALMKKLKF